MFYVILKSHWSQQATCNVMFINILDSLCVLIFVIIYVAVQLFLMCVCCSGSKEFNIRISL